MHTTNPLRWKRWLFALCSFALCLPLLACERQVQTCQNDQDCKAGERCITQKCTPQTDGGVEKNTEGVADGGESTISSEAPPWPDQSWPEPTFERPDRLVQNEKTPPSKGLRKLGETCDPTQTALPQDRCEEGHLCVYGLLPSAGICRKICDPQAPQCRAQEACNSILAPDLNQAAGHACVPTAQTGETCMHGLACPKDHVCAQLIETNTGVCLRGCNAAADCASGGQQGFCGSVATFSDPGQTTNACVIQSAGAGTPCSGPRLCGAGLRCLGDSQNKRCRKGCDGGTPCEQKEVCVPFKNTSGQVVYSLCLPERLERESCDATNRCAQGLSCVTLPNQARTCLKDCKSDAKLCDAQTETCHTWTTDRKACFRKDIPLGGSCDGGDLCAQGLSCLGETSIGPFFCLPPCSQDKDCSNGQTCQTLGSSGARYCASSCVNSSCPAPLSCGNNFCQPASAQLGERPQNDPCTLSPLAPTTERCMPGLRCIQTGDQGRCLRPCDPKAPSPCPGPIACAWLDTEQSHFCGSTSPASCDLKNSIFCEADARCIRKLFEETGRCVKSSQQPQDAFCLEPTLLCASGLRCAGDPLTFYRWRCRSSCDAQTNPCASGQACLNLGQGQACFAPCTNNTCTPTSLTCEAVQGQSICL